ncbi:MAG TPA: hypothetical protein VIG62_02890 [Blastocatellia bacterium]|jgi:hypothetical protein
MVPDWPPLAWLARCDKSSSIIDLFHGSRVEVTSDWFCEAAWAGDYQLGDFDQTDIVAGSGGRLRDGKATFVSSGSTVDRLNSIELGDGARVSNSLSCLLAFVNADIDPSYPRYFRHIQTLVSGLNKYNRFLATSAGEVQLTYFDNLIWDGAAITVRAKPGVRRDFSTFSRYHEFLEGSMRLLSKNITASERRYKYELLPTCSAGYDSATVTTLARQAGCRQVLCFERGGGEEPDSGKPLALALEMEPVVVEKHAWASMSMPEVLFIAADADGGDVYFKSAEPVLGGKILLTGFHGDKMWGKQTKDLSEHIVRGDISGLSLTEYRLLTGFIQCSAAFWGVKQIRDINALSNSDEMKPWDIPGDYSRPVCRRIVEEAGVPRELFGIKKRASWVRFNRSRDFLTAESMEDYLEWLGAARKAWIRHGRIPPILSPKVDQLELSIRQMIGRAVRDRHGLSEQVLRYTGLLRIGTMLFHSPPHLRKYTFPWAIGQARKNYPRP